jgi:transposase
MTERGKGGPGGPLAGLSLLRLADRASWEARVRAELASGTYGEAAKRMGVTWRTVARWARELGHRGTEGWPKGRPRQKKADSTPANMS